MAHDYFRPVAAFDIDDTLINENEEPRHDVVQLFNLLSKFGCRMIIWSNGGGSNEDSISYARRIRDKLGLAAEVLEKGSLQPDITVDDMDLFTRISEKTLGRVNIRV